MCSSTQSRYVLIIKYHILQAFETEIQKQAMKTQHKRGGKRHGTSNKSEGTCTHFGNNLYNL